MYDVSVVIPNCNGARYLNEAIDSVLNQSDVNVEVIVVDDGSTDGSRKILESYGDRIKVFYQENKGAPAARNLGWQNAKTQYIKFLDSDDVILPGALKAQLNQMMELGDNEIPYGKAIWVDENLNERTEQYPIQPIIPGQEPIHHILTESPLTSAPLHRKNLLHTVNGFDESVVKGQEYDLHLRLVLENTSFVFFNKNIYLFRQAADEKRISYTSIGKFHREIFLMLKKQQSAIRKKFANTSNYTRRAFSIRYMNYGKAILLEGNLIHSIKFFKHWALLTINCMVKFNN